MPLFSPVLNDPFFDKEVMDKAVATKWQMFKARLFGTRFRYSTDEGTVEGYRHNGTVFITGLKVPE